MEWDLMLACWCANQRCFSDGRYAKGLCTVDSCYTRSLLLQNTSEYVRSIANDGCLWQLCYTCAFEIHSDARNTKNICRCMFHLSWCVCACVCVVVCVWVRCRVVLDHTFGFEPLYIQWLMRFARWDSLMLILVVQSVIHMSEEYPCVPET